MSCPPDLAGQGREAHGAEEEHDEYKQTALILVSRLLQLWPVSG